MSDKSLRRTSGSSLNLRNHMNDNYVIVHNVSSSVAFEKYVQFARTMFTYSIRLYNKKDYQRAYVDFTKFQRFIHEKLPSHEGYDHERYVDVKRWLMQADESASQFLEEISFQLDIIEDQKINPDSRSGFMQELQKHNVDIFIPVWIDSDSTTDTESSRSRSGQHSREHSTSSPSNSGGRPHSSIVPPAPNGHVAADSHVSASPRGHSSSHSRSNSGSSAPAVNGSNGHHHLHLQPPVPQFHHQHNEPHTESAHHCSDLVHQQQHQQQQHSHVHRAHSESHSGSQSPAHNHLHSASPYNASPHDSSSHGSSPHGHSSHGAYNGDGMYQASFGHSSANRLHGHEGQHVRPPALPKYVLPGVFAEDAAIMRHYRTYTSFDIPMPTVNDCTLSIGSHQYLFEQHDFHISYAPFLKALPLELCMGRAATEVNRCFFIHLGIATQLHPFVLQSFFRFTAASERDEEEDWEQELAKTVTQYSGCVDANVLQYMWPTNFDKYRILLVSGPPTDPLLTCFVPVNRTRPVEDLYEVVIRNERDHYTLLRPVVNLNSRIKIIDGLLQEAKQQQKVYQVCDVESKPSRSVDVVMDQI